MTVSSAKPRGTAPRPAVQDGQTAQHEVSPKPWVARRDAARRLKVSTCQGRTPDPHQVTTRRSVVTSHFWALVPSTAQLARNVGIAQHRVPWVVTYVVVSMAHARDIAKDVKWLWHKAKLALLGQPQGKVPVHVIPEPLVKAPRCQNCILFQQHGWHVDEITTQRFGKQITTQHPAMGRRQHPRSRHAAHLFRRVRVGDRRAVDADIVLWQRAKQAHLLLEPVVQTDVIAVHKRDQIVSSRSDTSVARRRCAPVLRTCDQPNTRVVQRSNRPFDIVGRTVVDDQNFKIGIGLPADAANRARQGCRTIVDRDDDTDKITVLQRIAPR